MDIRTDGARQQNEEKTAAVGCQVEAGLLQLRCNEAPDIRTYYTAPATLAAIEALLCDTIKLLMNHGVEFWADCGTMLGAVRHGGIIPWDDDADLAYIIGGDGVDTVASVELQEAFAAAGFSLQRNRTDAYWQVGTNKSGETVSPVHVDIFSYRMVEFNVAQLIGASVPPGSMMPAIHSTERRYVCDDVRFRQEDPNSTLCNTAYMAGELYPLRRVPFCLSNTALVSGSTDPCTIMMPVVAQAEKVLARSLGTDFMRVARIRGVSTPFALN